MLLFMLGSTLSISISPVLAATDLDIDNDGVLDDVDTVSYTHLTLPTILLV